MIVFAHFWNQCDHIVETSPNGVSMRDDGCNEVKGAMWSYVSEMWGCHVIGWSTNHWQQCENTEINLNRIQLTKRDNTQQNKKDKPISCFLSKPQGSCFEVVCFRGCQGDVLKSWKLPRNLYCPFYLKLLLMAPKQKNNQKTQQTKTPFINKSLSQLTVIYSQLSILTLSFLSVLKSPST